MKLSDIQEFLESTDENSFSVRKTSPDKWTVFKKNNPVAVYGPTSKEKVDGWLKDKAEIRKHNNRSSVSGIQDRGGYETSKWPKKKKDNS